jgi:adenylate cyclase
MKDTEIGAWVTTTGLAGASELDLLRGFCVRLAAARFPLARATVLIDTLHPVHEGRAFRWRRDPTDEPDVLEYGRTHADSQYAEQWRRSPFYHLLAAGSSAMRRSLARGDPADFPAVQELRAQGHTDYLVILPWFTASQPTA